MKVEHTLKMKSLCPADGSVDHYEVTFFMKRFCSVENIQIQCERMASVRMYQEDLTQQLANVFGCPVKTHGHHAGGAVVSTVYCCPQK